MIEEEEEEEKELRGEGEEEKKKRRRRRRRFLRDVYLTHCFSILHVQRYLSISRRLAGPFFSSLEPGQLVV